MYLNTVILRDQQILAFQIAMQAVPRMEVRDCSRDVRCEAEPQSPREVQVLIDDVASQVAIRQKFRDDQDPPACRKRRLRLAVAVECHGWKILWRRRRRESKTDQLNDVGVPALSVKKRSGQLDLVPTAATAHFINVHSRLKYLSTITEWISLTIQQYSFETCHRIRRS